MKPVPQKRVNFNGMQAYFQQLCFSSTHNVFFRTVQWSAKKRPTAKFSATSLEVYSLYKWLKKHLFQNILKFNPFVFIKNKWLFTSSEGFSALEKNSVIFLRGQCCPSSWVWLTAANGNASLAHFSLNFNLLGRNLKKVRQRPVLSAEVCHTIPDHSAELFAERRRSLQAVKALWGLISRPY